jgi:hypothetical protein
LATIPRFGADGKHALLEYTATRIWYIGGAFSVRGLGDLCTNQSREVSMKTAFIRLITTGKFLRLVPILFFNGYVQADEMFERKFKVDDSTFKCILKMTPVRHFFVDNLAGDLAGTVAVAQAGKSEYPEGTLLQLIPNEAMIKQQKGFSPGTNDWEFFALESDKYGSKIVSRGAQEVNNFLGLNCFECHKAARAEFDLVCEQDHGCVPLPLTRAMIHAVQRTDPRCQPPEPVSAETPQR